jgi:hypothetical protein
VVDMPQTEVVTELVNQTVGFARDSKHLWLDHGPAWK